MENSKGTHGMITCANRMFDGFYSSPIFESSKLEYVILSRNNISKGKNHPCNQFFLV